MESNVNMIAKVFMTLMIGVLLIIGLAKFGQYIKIKEKQALYEAVDACLGAATWESHYGVDLEGNSAIAIQPMEEVYQKCMQDKGIEIEQVEEVMVESTESGELNEQ